MKSRVEHSVGFTGLSFQELLAKPLPFNIAVAIPNNVIANPDIFENGIAVWEF